MEEESHRRLGRGEAGDWDDQVRGGARHPKQGAYLATGLLCAPVFSVSGLRDHSSAGLRPACLHVQEILCQKVYRRLADIPGEVDLVDVFRRSEDIPVHLDDMLAKMPKAVWFQSGIRNDEVAECLARAGIKVVQDRCLMADHRRYCARP